MRTRTVAFLVALAVHGVGLGGCAIRHGEAAARKSVEIHGVVVGIPPDEIQSIRIVERLPDTASVNAVFGAHVTFASAQNGRDATVTSETGEFVVRLPSLSGAEDDFLEVSKSGYCGLQVTNLRIREKPLRLEPGRNFVIVKINRLESKAPGATGSAPHN